MNLKSLAQNLLASSHTYIVLAYPPTPEQRSAAESQGLVIVNVGNQWRMQKR